MSCSHPCDLSIVLVDHSCEVDKHLAIAFVPGQSQTLSHMTVVEHAPQVLGKAKAEIHHDVGRAFYPLFTLFGDQASIRLTDGPPVQSNRVHQGKRDVQRDVKALFKLDDMHRRCLSQRTTLA